ncbi:phosphate/phosphite/phosphonate ABC transporter substrate-binding protein [Fundidesulfovibrio butyratiphilus]
MGGTFTTFRLFPVVVWCVVAVVFQAQGVLAQHALTFGVVPQQSAVELAAQWAPLLKAISDKTGLSLDFETAPDIPTFEKRLTEGRYDIAYVNPLHYIEAHEAVGYNAFAREARSLIQGIIVVPQNSSLKTIKELNGLNVAFPSPGAFAATVLPLAILRKEGVHVTPAYVGSHDSVYLAVSKGFFPAGGGIRRTFEKNPASVRDTLRILWETPKYTPHALAFHPRVSQPTVAKLLKALVALHDTPEGRLLLERLHFKGFQPATDADWNDVRSLGLSLPHDAH